MSTAKDGPGSRFLFQQDMTMEEVLERIDKIEEEKLSILEQLRLFVAGTAKSKKRRDRKFLVGLLRDVFYLVFLIGHEIATFYKVTTRDEELPEEANIIAHFLGEVLNECRLLLVSPRLFPSRSARKVFLARVASLRPVIANIKAIEKQNRSSLWHVLNRDLTSLELFGSDYPENDRAKLRSLLPNTHPIFHPDRRDAKNPWNNWLDNSANAASGWIATQQKIPRLGDVLNRRKVYDYEALEARIETDEQAVRDSENDLPQLPAVGYDLQHMTWSGFATIPKYSVGFRVGSRKSTDADGVVTLEHLSEAIEGINLWQTDMFFLHAGPPLNPVTLPAMLMLRSRMNMNVPYFRYAMAYKP